MFQNPPAYQILTEIAESIIATLVNFNRVRSCLFSVRWYNAFIIVFRFIFLMFLYKNLKLRFRYTRQRTCWNPLLTLLFPPFCFSIWTVFNFFILNQSPTTPKSISTFFIFLYEPLQRLLNKNPSMTPSFLVFFYRTTAKHNSEKYSTPENIVIKILFSTTLVQHKKKWGERKQRKEPQMQNSFHLSFRTVSGGKNILLVAFFISNTQKIYYIFFQHRHIMYVKARKWRYMSASTYRNA